MAKAKTGIKAKVRKSIGDEAIFAAFTHAVAENGYARANLRDIAKGAGIAEQALRSRFPAKANLLSAWRADKASRLEAELSRIKDFAAYQAVDRLQALLEGELRLCAGDKKFLRVISPRPFPPGRSPALSDADEDPFKGYYVATASAFLAGPEAANRRDNPLIRRACEEVLWLHHNAVLAFWFKDDSDRGDATSEFIDKSLNLLVAVMGHGAFHHGEELIRFLFGSRLKEGISRAVSAFGLMDIGKLFRGMTHAR
jgi:AcrR family transcriptional regulator